MPFPNVNTKLKTSDFILTPQRPGEWCAWEIVVYPHGGQFWVKKCLVEMGMLILTNWPLLSFLFGKFPRSSRGPLLFSPEKANTLCLASIVTEFFLFYKYHLTNNHVSYSRHYVCVIIAINSFNIGDYSHQSPVLESISRPKHRGNLDNCC